MMSQLERKHVSKLVPADHRLLMPLLLAVTIVNSAVSFALERKPVSYSDH
jgi:hypothetical protein